MDIFTAVESGNEEKVRELLDTGIEIDAKDRKERTPLMHAALKGNYEIAKMLLEAGADVNAKGFTDWTPIMYASYYGHLKVVELLFSTGADINALTWTGSNSLIFAAEGGYLDVISFLLQKGANVDNKNVHHSTALGAACQFKRFKAIKLLLEARKGSKLTVGNIINFSDAEKNGAILLLLKTHEKLFIGRDKKQLKAFKPRAVLKKAW